MGEGQIIFLNGASSSAKSTVAKELQEALEGTKRVCEDQGRNSG